MARGVCRRWRVVVLCVVLVVAAAAPASAIVYRGWTRQVDSGDGGEYGESLCVDADGNIYLAGYTNGNLAHSGTAGYGDSYLCKFDPSGTRLWTTQSYCGSEDSGEGICIDSEGCLWVAGTVDGLYAGAHKGGADAYIRRYYTSSGDPVGAEAQLGTSAHDGGRDVCADGFGNVYLTGYTGGSLGATNLGSADAYVAQFSAGNGALGWVRQWGSASDDSGTSVCADSAGNVYVAGYAYGSIGSGDPYNGLYDVFVCKYDNDGQAWDRQFGTERGDFAMGVVADGMGSIFVTGYTKGDFEGTNLGDFDAFVMKINAASGTVAWKRQFGTASEDKAFDIATDGQGNVYIAGHTAGGLGNPNLGVTDVFLCKYDTLGNRVWVRQLGTDDYDYGRCIATYGPNAYYVGGQTDGNMAGASGQSPDAFVTRYYDTVPEPGAAVLVLLGSVALLKRRRR